MKKSLTTRQLVKMAMYLTLFMILDFIANRIGIFQMPQGGSLGLGVVPLLIASYDLGVSKGVAVSLLSIVLMYLTGDVWFVSFGQFLLDYIIAFGVYGLASAFPSFNKEGAYPLMTGIIITNVVRGFSSYLAGVWYFQVTPFGSMIYQVSYMVPTLLLTLVVVPLLMKRIEGDI